MANIVWTFFMDGPLRCVFMISGCKKMEYRHPAEHYCLRIFTSFCWAKLASVPGLQARAPSRDFPRLSERRIPIWSHIDPTGHHEKRCKVSIQGQLKGGDSEALLYLVGSTGTTTVHGYLPQGWRKNQVLFSHIKIT